MDEAPVGLSVVDRPRKAKGRPEGRPAAVSAQQLSSGALLACRPRRRRPPGRRSSPPPSSVPVPSSGSSVPGVSNSILTPLLCGIPALPRGAPGKTSGLQVIRTPNGTRGGARVSLSRRCSSRSRESTAPARPRRPSCSPGRSVTMSCWCASRGAPRPGSGSARLLKDPALELDPLAELLLFCAARAELVAKVIGPAREAGRDVVCDRFSDSSVAYQGVARGLGAERVEEICDLATGGVWPDLTILLRIDPEPRRRGSAGVRPTDSRRRGSSCSAGSPRAMTRSRGATPSASGWSTPMATARRSTRRCSPRSGGPCEGARRRDPFHDGGRREHAGDPGGPGGGDPAPAAGGAPRWRPRSPRPGHAYIFRGPRGSGKAAAARAFAAELLAEGPPDPDDAPAARAARSLAAPGPRLAAPAGCPAPGRGRPRVGDPRRPA